LVNHNGIKQWLDEAKLDNLHAPVELDLNRPWPINTVDAIYTANTLHIVSKPLVEQFFTSVNKHLASKGLVCIYGPFKYNGNFTSESNQRFDEFLNQQDCQSGIRDFEWVQQLAEQAGLMLVDDIAMPANNQLLIFKRH
jgi:cyclopropane fatty-acyl-phospholipid synthase-like methyltransferase